ncbi:MAG: histidinol dehydrogenase [Gammaproteobacteria bacterium RBG_16_51_14]|nr:MAG: histidinol dehydrogenase [Gammaproteobacteria bacterium RBG_16_51_14]
MQIRRLNSSDPGFEQDFVALLSGSDEPDAAVTDTVRSVLRNIRERGDKALVEYTNRFDQRDVSIDELELSEQTVTAAVDAIAPELKQGLEQAAMRIRSYHERQKLESWSYKDRDGTLLGQQVTPLVSVGVYVPGGKAAYPSSVLMNVVPAKVAGVNNIIMVVPAPKGEINPLVLAAASIAGVTRAFSIGGAQAVAALAYGTETIPRVDKIVGPGNIYVATAKRMVFGTVGIDMIAGPSEVLIISDGGSSPDWIAMDLFAQAEHDEDACAILISPDNEFLDSVAASIQHLLPEMDRAGIIEQSLQKNGALIQVRDLREAIDISNRVAPEHLELSVADPEALLTGIRHAGAIFMGYYTAEALGDYCAGPNHVLPTARTARFSSPLGVYDFQKRSSLIMCSDQSASGLAKTASVLARGEGLTAHARSAEFRIKGS